MITTLRSYKLTGTIGGEYFETTVDAPSREEATHRALELGYKSSGLTVERVPEPPRPKPATPASPPASQADLQVLLEQLQRMEQRMPPRRNNAEQILEALGFVFIVFPLGAIAFGFLATFGVLLAFSVMKIAAGDVPGGF